MYAADVLKITRNVAMNCIGACLVQLGNNVSAQLGYWEVNAVYGNDNIKVW